MAEAHKSKEEWNELSKAPSSSNFVICFRGELYSAPEGISNGGTEPSSADEFCSAYDGKY